MKKILKKISDIQNAMRVLEIMDKVSCDIEKSTVIKDYYVIKPKHSIPKEDAEDLRKIILYKEHYKKRSRLWKLFFPNIREGYRFL